MGLKFCKTADDNGRAPGRTRIIRPKQEHVYFCSSCRQRWIRKSMESRAQKDSGEVCLKGDV